MLGQRASLSGTGVDYMVASESAALVQCGYTDFQDVLPGQAVIIEEGQKPVLAQITEPRAYAPDIFEYVYFARQDSVIDGIDVGESRTNMGRTLAEEIKRQLGPRVDDIDVVMPVPDTSTTSTLEVARILNKPFVQGFVKNRYIFRLVIW